MRTVRNGRLTSVVIAFLLAVLAGIAAPATGCAAGIGQQLQQHQSRQNGVRTVPPGLSGAQRPATVPRTAPDHRPARAMTDALGAIYTYDAVGNRESATYPNGMVTRYRYDPGNRLVELHTQRGGATIHRYAYTLDRSGLRTRVDAREADGSTRITLYAIPFSFNHVFE